MRPKDIFKPVNLELAFTPQIVAYLEELVSKGTFGSNPNEAARLIISQAVSDMIENGVIPRRRWTIENGELIPAELEENAADQSAEKTSQEVETLYESQKVNEISSADIYNDAAPLLVEVNEWVLRHLKRYPQEIFNLSPRQFELTVAEILERLGWEIHVTPASRDGGKDIVAFLPTALGPHLCLIETKLFRLDRPVGVGIIRGLYGVVEDADASSGALITTSYFTDPAIQFAKAHPNKLHLHDFDALKKWIGSLKV